MGLKKERIMCYLKARPDLASPSIGVPPTEPSVTCRSNTYPKGFYCSWQELHTTHIPIFFEVDVQHNLKTLDVNRDPVHKNRCRVEFPEVFSTSPYKVNVTAFNALGKASTTLSFEEFSIVKPDPPERVTAKPIRFNPRRLEVSWHSPSTWPDIESFPLKYFLRYRPVIREQWQHVELSESTSHIITDAYAGKEYVIQVAAKDTEIGTWSDWSVPFHATPWIEDPLPITSTTEVDTPTETRTSPIPSSNAPQKAEPPVGRAARYFFFDLICKDKHTHTYIKCLHSNPLNSIIKPKTHLHPQHRGSRAACRASRSPCLPSTPDQRRSRNEQLPSVWRRTPSFCHYADKFWQADLEAEDKSIHHLTAVSWGPPCVGAEASVRRRISKFHYSGA
ncbi:Ciliary neurotrophic factor receptor subunit alpha [Oryzias melastigma]|uniref:Ciliary neurotrophic factor receptor subunit alpha n=1 Tax=Oryzias melastigma TaxID=30732 RepID=A0A834BP46_ORYME|nr:Ciliary neurotrophic factor receptor subunit alpha [Oryzias melastigma]